MSLLYVATCATLTHTHTHTPGCHGCCLQWASDVCRAVRHAAAGRSSLPWHRPGNVQRPPHPERHKYTHAHYPGITGNSNQNTVPEKDCKRYSPELNMLKIYTETRVLIVLGGVFLISYFMFYFDFLFLI